LSSRIGLQANTEIADSNEAAPHQSPTKSYAPAANSGSSNIVSPSKEYADQGFTLDATSAVPSPKVSAVQIDANGLKTVTSSSPTHY
jgi:hypothetical protein